MLVALQTISNLAKFEKHERPVRTMYQSLNITGHSDKNKGKREKIWASENEEAQP